MKKLSHKNLMTPKFLRIFKFMVLLLLIVRIGMANSTPRIYLIRHAKVGLKKPGWGTSKYSAEYKEAYNVSGIEAFNPEDVLQKIENHEIIDTVFCSPQKRALETTLMLFGKNVVLKTENALTELDYPMVKVPVLQLPVKGWLIISRIIWMAGINQGDITGYKERLDELNTFSDELLKFAQRDGIAVVVAHGMVNRELVKILKNHGWEYCKNGKDGFGTLSVNCLENF